MNGTLKRYLLRFTIGLAIAGVLVWVFLDQRYSDTPKFPDPASGRTVMHSFGYDGHVYLTADEDAPYEWIKWLWVACAVSVALVNGADGLMKSGKK
jgi:hypothetical protein